MIFGHVNDLDTSFAWLPQPLRTAVEHLKRTDFMFRPRVIWSASKSWRLVFGADVFGGDATGAFGRYSDRDRVYTEARWSF